MMAAKFSGRLLKSRLLVSSLGSLSTITSSAQFTLEKIEMSERVDFWKVKSAKQSEPLVLIFSWFHASMSAVQKYANLYHQRGLDVLVVRGSSMHIIWPPSALKLCNELEKCLGEIPSYQKYFIHSFSVGTYNYTIARMCTRSGVPYFSTDKVIGQIYDSFLIGSLVELAEALNVITDYKLLQILIKKLSLCFCQLTGKTQKMLGEVGQFNKDNFLPVPSLFFYGENDIICNINSTKEFLALLKEKHGDNIWEKSWPLSIHAGHLHSHRDDYISTWNSFVDKLGI